jgi:spore coat protein U-like protein
MNMKRIIKHVKKSLKKPEVRKKVIIISSLSAVVSVVVAVLVSQFIISCLTCSVSKGATTTGTLTATASVASTCTVSGNTMAFGAYTGAVADQTGVITANCTKGTSFSVAMTTAQTGGFYQMTSGAEVLNYKVYSNNPRTVEIVAGTVILTDNNASGNNQNVTIYGRVPASQIAAIGAYSGTTTFTLTY